MRGVLRSLAPIAAGIALALALHAALGLAFRHVSFEAKVAQDVGIAIILAVSLTIVNGFTGQFSMGHAGFMMIGGYFAAAVSYYGGHRWFGPQLAQGGALSHALDLGTFDGTWWTAGDAFFLCATLGGGLLAALAGWLVGLPSLRLRGDYLAIVTLGFGEIARVLFQYSRPQLTSGEALAATPFPEQFLHLGESLGMIRVPSFTSLFWIYVFVTLTIVVALRLKHSSHGRALLAIREDEIAAEAMGVHTTRYKVRAFVISAFFAGIAGSLVAHQVGSINAGDLGFMRSFEVIIMVVLGGLGSVSGAALAALVLTILPEALREFADYRMIVYSLVLILLMIVRPQGVFGVREVWDLWARKRAPGSKGAAP